MNTLMHQKTDTHIKLITSNKIKPSKSIGLQGAPIKTISYEKFIISVIVIDFVTELWFISVLPWLKYRFFF